VYVGFVAAVVNLVVAAVDTLLCKAFRAPDGVDATSPDDYTHEPTAVTPQLAVASDELPDPVPAT
jgi:hypothetical protein